MRSGKQGAGPSAMEGSGFYNRHSSLQAAGIALLLPTWEEECRTVPFGDEPLVIADYGCSQGRNSMVPMRIAIAALGGGGGEEGAIQVFHIDLPGNDFASLFTTLHEDPDSYMAGASAVFPMAIGRSYFEPVVPPDCVHLAWNSWTLHWMSRKAADAPDHIIPGFSKSAAVVASVRERHAEDWKLFLELRARELRAGGRLLSAFTGSASEETGWEHILDELWAAVVDMGRAGLLSREEQDRLTMQVGARSRAEVEAPFDARGRFADLELKRADILQLHDPLWEEFRVSGDARKLAEDRANATRAWSAPAIMGLLDADRDRSALIDELFARFTARLAANPTSFDPYLASVLVAKGA